MTALWPNRCCPIAMCSETTPAAAEGTRLTLAAIVSTITSGAAGRRRAVRGAAKAVQRPRRLLCPYRVARTSALLRAAHLVLWQPAFSWSRSGELAESALAARSKQTVSFLRKHRVQRVGFLSVTLNALALWLAVSGVHDCAITVHSCGLRNAPIAHRDVRFHGRVHDCRCHLGASFGQQPLNRRVLLDS